MLSTPPSIAYVLNKPKGFGVPSKYPNTVSDISDARKVYCRFRHRIKWGLIHHSPLNGTQPTQIKPKELQNIYELLALLTDTGWTSCQHRHFVVKQACFKVNYTALITNVRQVTTETVLLSLIRLQLEINLDCSHLKNVATTPSPQRREHTTWTHNSVESPCITGCSTFQLRY